MKKIVFVFAIIAVFIACQSNPKIGTDTANTSIKSDTAPLNLNAFTDKAREVQLNGVNDTIVSSDGNTYVKLKPKEAEPATVKVAEINNKPKAQHSSSRAARRASSVGSGAGTSKSENSTVPNGTTGSGDIDTAATPTPVAKKKGWSKAAKGAVIGAGSGAAAGAILTKKKGKGAIIGGIIGATGGYIIGRGKDKKDGRYYKDGGY
jgi:hypothetical protein